MLQEVRKLLFSEDIIHAALLQECAAQGIEIPNSKLQSVRVDGYRAGPGSDTASKGRVVLEFVAANPDKPFEVVLNEHFVIGALIVACRTHGVPLPRSATKKLQMTDNGLARTLAFRRDTNGKPTAEDAESGVSSSPATKSEINPAAYPHS